MKIALAQMQLVENLELNFNKTIKYMEEAASKGAQLICFPELQFSPFFPQYPRLDVEKYTLSIDDPHVIAIQNHCKKLNIIAFPNFYLKENNQCYDASPVISSEGTLLGISKMVHIVRAPQFYEEDYYTPSETGFKVYDTTLGKIGVVICFDRHYPESIRSCALQGAKLIIIPTANTKSEPMELFEWELRIPAFQNNVFIAMCNRVGLEGDMDFSGESIVVDPNGNVVKKAQDQEEILYAEIDLEMVSTIRKQRPYINLRRPQAY